jgi:hypothetical protein
VYYELGDVWQQEMANRIVFHRIETAIDSPFATSRSEQDGQLWIKERDDRGKHRKLRPDSVDGTDMAIEDGRQPFSDAVRHIQHQEQQQRFRGRPFQSDSRRDRLK